MHLIKTTLAVLLSTSTLATADSKQPKPEPTDARLAQLVGRWQGTSSFTLSGKTLKFAVTTACERAVVGPAVICTMVAVSGAMRLEEAHLYGFDKASNTYHLFTVNNWGEAYDHAATWTDAAKVAFEHAGTRDGKPLREVYAYELKQDQLTMHGTLSVDGKVIGDGMTTLKRLP